MNLDTLIESLPQTAPKTKHALQKLSIYTYGDLLYHIPNRYKDYRNVLKIDQFNSQKKDVLFNGNDEAAYVTIQGTVEKFDQVRLRSLTIQKAFISDGTGMIECVWFRQPYLYQFFTKGKEVSISGLLDLKSYKPSLKVEEYEAFTEDKQLLHTGRLVAVYPETRGISSRTIREKIAKVFESVGTIKETYSTDFIKKYSLLNLSKALTTLHYPSDYPDLAKAKKRLAFDELFVRMLSSKRIRDKWKKESVAEKLIYDKSRETKIESFKKSFDFSLTNAQERSISEVLSDMQRTQPLNRLLQGDVGSGKTVVAATAAYLSYLNEKQTLFMAPTDILAKQHFNTLTRLYSHKTLEESPRILLHTASHKAKKDELKHANIIVGTHSLITHKAEFDHVGLIIIDEQHKFGVSQRALLKEKGYNPHILTMTATPIPRTVCLTMYGELDVSVIDEMPKGRKEIKSFVVPPTKRDDAYVWIKKEIKKNDIQVFIVCPFIETSESETLQSIKAAQVEYQRLKDTVFPDYKIGLLHGKMKADEKDDMMSLFATHKIQILVSTPILEVGVDIPNANIILIETPERFGLA
ncbi:MAG: ATP-dependent DNA helicase RecG, partial [Candidatus Roizmanbacteria bacterium]